MRKRSDGGKAKSSMSVQQTKLPRHEVALDVLGNQHVNVKSSLTGKNGNQLKSIAARPAI